MLSHKWMEGIKIQVGAAKANNAEVSVSLWNLRAALSFGLTMAEKKLGAINLIRLLFLKWCQNKKRYR